MSPTPQELELGAKAYTQVRLYENVTAKDIRQTPWLWAIYAGLLILAFILLAPHKASEEFPFFLFVPVFFILRLWQNRTAQTHYATHKMLLKLLAEKYGDALPWVAEEKQLAAARKLEEEMAHDHQAGRA
jgi:hypothetical protein